MKKTILLSMISWLALVPGPYAVTVPMDMCVVSTSVR